jgi:hypothetical protein
MPDEKTMSGSVDESREVRLVTGRLLEQLDRPQMESEVLSAVESEFMRFNSARVRDFIPVFVERRLRTDLRALSHT